MGGNSSKQSLEIERNKRLREFEEELVEQYETSSLRSGSVSPPIRDHHFTQFMDNENGQKQQNHQQRTASPTASELLSETFDDDPEDPVTSDNKDKEVEDAIAELEETFRHLTPDAENNEGQKYGSDGYRLMPNTKEFSRSQSCGPLNVTAEKGQSGQLSQQMGETRERRGTPMMTGAPHAYNRRRPLGLAHLSRSSGGLGGPINVADGVDVKGALSAPPGVSNLREPMPQQLTEWKPPNIDGFDVDKFREVNRPDISISVRLPTSGGRDEDEQRRNSTPNNTSASYTKDELELFRKLEREVY